MNYTRPQEGGSYEEKKLNSGLIVDLCERNSIRNDFVRRSRFTASQN